MKRPVLFVILPRIPYPLEKGDKLRAYYLIRGLKEHYHITLFALYREKYDSEVVRQIASIADRYSFFHISLFSVAWNAILALFTGKPFQVAYFSNSRMKRAIRNAAHESKPDAVLCQLVRTAEFAKGLDTKKILDYQDTLSLGMKRRAEKSPRVTSWFYQSEGRRLYRYEKKVSDWFDHTLIITEQDRDALPVHNDRVHVIPNGVDTLRYQSGDCKKKNQLLFVGNMSYAPNVDAMEYFTNNVLPGVLMPFPATELVIAGAKPHSRIKMLASDNVIVTGWVDDLREYYCRARIFVAPMQIGTGLQNKLLEAMSMGLACITTTLANNAIGATHGKEIWVANSPEEWVAAVAFLLSNRELRDEIAANGKKFVAENYSWNSQIEKLCKIIE